MTASQFTHAELRAALTLMLDGPVQSGSLDAAVDTALAMFQQALEEHAMRLFQQDPDSHASYAVIALADALGEPEGPSPKQVASAVLTPDAEPPGYRCSGCGKTGRFAAHMRGCQVGIARRLAQTGATT